MRPSHSANQAANPLPAPPPLLILSMQLSRRARIAGGTGFWGPEQEAPRYGEPSTAPSVVMRPAPGSALLYGGSITHAGMPVMMGCRVIFLASFSSRRLDLELLESS